MSESAILTAARAAISAALPLLNDVSDDSADPKPAALPAFSATLTRDNAEPAAMGSTLEEVTLTLEVEAIAAYATAEAGRAAAIERGQTIAATVKSSAAVLALSHFMQTVSSEVDLSKGEDRLARVTVQVSILATI